MKYVLDSCVAFKWFVREGLRDLVTGADRRLRQPLRCSCRPGTVRTHHSRWQAYQKSPEAVSVRSGPVVHAVRRVRSAAGDIQNRLAEDRVKAFNIGTVVEGEPGVEWA